MGRITVDRGDWPLVRITFDGTVDEEQFEAYVRAHADLLDLGEPYVAIFDAREGGVPSAMQRQLMASCTRTRQEDIAKLCVRCVFVISNPVIRGALTAILWLQPMPCPHDVVSSMEDAERILDTDLKLLSA